jgi:hypothetical protein
MHPTTLRRAVTVCVTAYRTKRAVGKEPENASETVFNSFNIPDTALRPFQGFINGRRDCGGKTASRITIRDFVKQHHLPVAPLSLVRSYGLNGVKQDVVQTCLCHISLDYEDTCYDRRTSFFTFYPKPSKLDPVAVRGFQNLRSLQYRGADP